MSRRKYEVADVIERFGKQFTESCHPSSYRQRVLNALTLCRTS